MITVEHSADFSATHDEVRLPAWHPCSHFHGHEWTLTIEVSSTNPLPESESVDLHVALAQFDEWVERTLAHQHLNDVDPTLHNGSSMDLAAWVYSVWRGQVPHLTAVHVCGPTVDRGLARQQYEYRPVHEEIPS